MADSCMHNASGRNYRNSSFIVDVAMGQIPCSTERISSSKHVESLSAFFASLTLYTVPRNVGGLTLMSSMQ